MIDGDPDGRVVQYLLDELSADDRDAFEDEYLGDGEAHAQMLAIETELIDRYCAGMLSPEQRQRFERRYLETEEGRERVEFARTLRRYGQREGQTAPAPIAWRARHRPERWAAWAAVVIAAITAVAAFQQARKGRAARNDRQSLQQQLQQQQERGREQERRLAQLSGEVAAARQQARVLEELLGTTATDGAGSAVLALASGLRRDAGTVPRLTLTPDRSLVRLSLHVPGPPRPAYRASLQTPEGRELWSRDGLPLVQSPGGPTVTFVLPAAVLSAGQYVVTLTDAATPRGDSEAEYVFEVRRRAS